MNPIDIVIVLTVLVIFVGITWVFWTVFSFWKGKDDA